MIGKEILNYRIIQFIGAGGMGAVYLAENKFISKQKVAVKVSSKPIWPIVSRGSSSRTRPRSWQN